MDKASIEGLCTDLKQASVRSASSNGGFLQVELESGNLSVGSSWRMWSQDWIIGSSTKQETVSATISAIFGFRIVSVHMVGEFHDLCIKFENEVVLETFADSGEFESWTLSFGFEKTYVAGPGRLWSGFVK
jgi:hypothetical protein